MLHASIEHNHNYDHLHENTACLVQVSPSREETTYLFDARIGERDERESLTVTSNLAAISTIYAFPSITRLGMLQLTCVLW